MSNWNEYRLGDLGKTYTGLSGKKKDDFGRGSNYIPYLNILENSRIDPEFLDQVQIRQGEHQNQVKRGDIFFTTSSETIEDVGMTSVLLDDLPNTYLNSFCFGFRPYDLETILPEFFGHLLRSEKMRREISYLGQGSTRYNISKTQLVNRLAIVAPEVSEQRRIALILNTADRAIAKTEDLIAKLKQIKSGLLFDLLKNGVDESGRIRTVKANWRKLSLADACCLLKDGTHLPPKRVVNGPLLLSVQNMQNGELVLTQGDTRVSQLFYDQMHKTWQIEVGDVLLAVVGATLGKAAKVTPLPPFTLQRSVAVLRGNPSILNNDFLFLTVRSDDFQRELWKSVNQTAQPGLYLNELSSLQIRIPDLSEQLRIVRIVEANDEEIRQESLMLQKLKTVKLGLMKDLLTGERLVSTEMKNV